LNCPPTSQTAECKANNATLRGAATHVVSCTKTLVAIIDGPSAKRSVETAGKPVRVGTSSENTIVVDDERVSRRHCELVPTGGGVLVRDTGSTNGTFLGAVRLSEAIFCEPFCLRIGETILSVTPHAGTLDLERSTNSRFGDMLGRSDCMREMFADLIRLSPSDASVLIEGETGTGKELVADSIHRASRRAEKPYVVFDCSAVPPTLIESELFGHERGAFTGAVSQRPGVFEQAHGGTIFLDELGELPRELQPKLLRVLEKREVRRIGSSNTIAIDIRVLAATNRNLIAEVERGNFREDLFFRISTTHVHVPPLRDRLDDLPVLMSHFLSRATPPRSLDEIPEHVVAMFRAHRWPGNVRELQNAVQRLLLTPQRPLGGRTPGAVPLLSLGNTAETALPPTEFKPLRIARREAYDEFERAYVQRLLARSGGNVRRGAAIAEVSRQMIERMIHRHGL
jgi:transcriptional regulator with PAS, ATPase and Fis domain